MSENIFKQLTFKNKSQQIFNDAPQNLFYWPWSYRNSSEMLKEHYENIKGTYVS